MYNKVFLIGRLTRDPEAKSTSAGVMVSRFTLAINRSSKRDSEADFIRIVAWRKLAETCNNYLRKGKLIAIEGRLQIGSYEKNGQQIQSAEVIADSMQMLEKKGAEDGAFVPRTDTTASSPASGEEPAPF
ncbi:single-stranded DNA-binding protein [Candidatus Termititenax dinenymphae]|uniref:Single-stranded DNA-binding protein n=1 Tax=Candidatus Termititenax dinenymphae TaxID=2218523 RepID=A0A388TLY7_9BACT|nr:single-stranded DNA-binding protein [Candidatus Termititenax dinenymphae]